MLLSTGMIQGHSPGPALVARPMSHKLALSGSLSGTIQVQSQGGQNYLVTVTVQGSSGNSTIGQVTIQTETVTNLSFLNSIGSKTSTLSNLPLQLTASGGTIVAGGKLQISRSRNDSSIPFLMTATVTGGTGSFAGATGSFSLQGTLNPLAGNSLAAQLRGAIILHS